jgi:hypothetical protein
MWKYKLKKHMKGVSEQVSKRLDKELIRLINRRLYTQIGHHTYSIGDLYSRDSESFKYISGLVYGQFYIVLDNVEFQLINII